MANNEYVNKVVLGNNTLIDLTGDDVARSNVISGIKFHLPSGEGTTGTCTFDADTSDGTAVAAEIIKDKIAYVNGSQVVGTMTVRGKQDIGITDADTPVSILAGYHDGSGSATIAAAQKELLIAGNIKSGVTILGVTGTYTGSAISAQSKTVTPYLTEQTVQPDSGYDYLSSVTIEALSVVEQDNQQGGKTVTIGTVAPTT